MSQQQGTDAGCLGLLLIAGAIYGWTLTGTTEERIGIFLMVLAVFGWRSVFKGIGGLIRLGFFASVVVSAWWYYEGQTENFALYGKYLVICPALTLLRSIVLKGRAGGSGTTLSPVRRFLRRVLS